MRRQISGILHRYRTPKPIRGGVLTQLLTMALGAQEYYPDMFVVWEADSPVKKFGRNQCFKFRSSKSSAPFSHLKDGDRVRFTAVEDPWANGLGAYLQRVKDVELLPPFFLEEHRKFVTLAERRKEFGRNSGWWWQENYGYQPDLPRNIKLWPFGCPNVKGWWMPRSQA